LIIDRQDLFRLGQAIVQLPMMADERGCKSTSIGSRRRFCAFHDFYHEVFPRGYANTDDLFVIRHSLCIAAMGEENGKCSSP